MAAPDDLVRLAVQVQPRASRNEITGLVGDALRVRLTAPPVEGAANEALIAFLAERLGLPRRQLTLVAGQGSRRKLVAIAGGGTREAVLARLLSSAQPPKR